MKILDKLELALADIRKKTDFVPKIGLVLGSGLGGLADDMDIVSEISYSEISDFPISTVSGHAGKFLFGYIEDVPVVVMQGRVHYYEGYDIHDVVLPIRIMGLLGAKILFLTNAAGGIRRDFSKGCLMVIRDHISSLVPSPLIGPNIDELGVRFPDMSCVYDEELCTIIKNSANELSINVEEGVYIQTSGPNYETPAEIRAYSLWGADAVGMSTACEAMTARHMGIRVCGISCITNMAAGISDAPLSHAEVKETADRVGKEFASLVKHSVSKMKSL
ncbi:MAG: purine-nucleoside phosphorylase [Oscillospiraceae bacterium]|nr:purine-nucleoside phosphorylase [Oscillospiraceae bacterium]